MPFEVVDDDLTTPRTPLGVDEMPPRTIETAPDVLGPAFRTQNVIGSVLAAESYPGKRKAEVNHNPLDIIKGTSYEENYLDRFVGSESEMETRDIMLQIAREERDRDRLANAGWPGFLAETAAGTIDPTLAMPGGAFVKSAKGGYALLRSMASVGGAGAAAVLAQEAALQGSQRTRTVEESIGNIGAATVLAGLLGGAVAKFATGAERRAGLRALEQIKGELKSGTSATGLAAPQGATAADTRTLEPRPMMPAMVTRAYDKSREMLRRGGEVPVVGKVLGPAGKAMAAVLGVPEWLIKQSGPLTRMAYSSSTAGKRAAFDLVESPLQFKENELGVPTSRNGPAVETTARIAIDGTRWKLQQEMDRLYQEYYYGAGKAPAFGMTRARIDQARGLNGERLGPKQFGKEVRDAMINGDKHDIPEVQAAAEWMRKEVFDPWKEAAIRLKLLPEDVTVKTAQSYFMRVYDKSKIVAQRPAFTKQVVDWLTGDQGAKAQIKDDLQTNRNLRAERTKALRKVERRLETIQKRQDEIEARLSERNMDVDRAGKRVEKLEERQRAAQDEVADLEMVVRDLQDVVKDPELKAELAQLQRELSDLKKADKPVTLEDLERADKDEEAGILTGPLRKAARIASGQQKAPKLPSFVAYMAREGGIKDIGGDVLARVGDAKKAPGLIAAEGKEARDLDAWGEKLTQDFPEIFIERPSPDEVLDLIEQSVIKNEPSWFLQLSMKPEDLDAYEQARVIEYAAQQAGIDLKSPADVADMLRNRDARDLDDLTAELDNMAEPLPDELGESRPATSIAYPNGGPRYDHLGTFQASNPRQIGMEAADYVIREGKKVGGEALLVMDGNGVIHADGTGSGKSVAVPPELAIRMDIGGSNLLIHHNHPSSRGLSNQDIGQLSRPGMSVVWAHGNDGKLRYRASLPPELVGSPQGSLFNALVTAYNAANDAIRKRLQDLVIAGKLAVEDANKIHAHLRVQALHNAGLIDYFGNYDAVLPSGFDILGLMKEATEAARFHAEVHLNANALRAVGRPGRSARTIRHPGDMGIPSPYGASPARERVHEVRADQGSRGRNRPQEGRGEQLALFEPAGDIESPKFKEWFGNSKVVDEKGEPLVVYKGMWPYDWTKETPTSPGPEIESIGRTTELPAFNAADPTEPGVRVAGFFGDKETASRFGDIMGGAVYPVYLSLQKPLVIDAKGAKAGKIQFGPEGKPFREAVRSGEYDGVIIKNTADEGDVYVALEPTQIKSVFNKGEFDPENPNILAEPDRELPPFRDPTIPLRIQRESMEEAVNVRRQSVQAVKDEIEKFKRYRKTAAGKERLEGARKGEAQLNERATRGRRGVLQDRSARLDTARELMTRAQQNVQAELDDLRLKAEEKLLSWQGKSAGDAQAALKRRKEYAAERDRLDALKNEAGIETPERNRLEGADRAVDTAIKRIIRSDRDKSPEELTALADEIVERILGSPDGRLPYDLPSGGPNVGPPKEGPPSRGPLAHRQFMIPDENIKDWLIADPEQIAHTYLGSIVPDVLLTERFGDVDMTRQFREINEEYAAKIRNSTSERERIDLRKEQERVIGDLAAMRDRLRGVYGFTSDTVMKNAARIAGAAGSINTLADMGGSAISQITDLAGPVYAYGLGKVFGDGWKPFVKNLAEGNKGALGKAKRQYNAMGIAIDMAFNTRNLDEVGEQYHPRTKAERALKGTAQAFMNANLSAPATDMAKTIAAVVTGNEIFRATKAVAEGKATAKQITNLAASNIDEEMAGRIWKSFNESGAVEDGVYLPNTADWTDDAARRAFEGAVSREVNIHVVTPGQEKALWLSNPILKVLGQFKAFIASSSVRILAANLQKRDAQALQGLVTSIALGALGYKAYTVATGQEASDRWQDWVKEGVSRSGVLGWLDEGNSLASKFTRGQLDLYRGIGADKPLSRYASRGVLGALLGPTAGKIENLAQATGALAAGEFTAADTRAARRLMPLQNLFYIRQLLNQVEEGFNAKLGIPERKQ